MVRLEDLVGLEEIAVLLKVPRSTVDQWRWRGVLPDPLKVISGNPIWYRQDIEAWAIETGRPKKRAHLPERGKRRPVPKRGLG